MLRQRLIPFRIVRMSHISSSTSVVRSASSARRSAVSCSASRARVGDTFAIVSALRELPLRCLQRVAQTLILFLRFGLLLSCLAQLRANPRVCARLQRRNGGCYALANEPSEHWTRGQPGSPVHWRCCYRRAAAVWPAADAGAASTAAAGELNSACSRVAVSSRHCRYTAR